MQNKIHIGKVIDAHGIKGDIYCLIFSGDVSWITKLKSLSLKYLDMELSFKILKIRAFKKGFIASLENLNDRNLAESYKSYDIWVESSIFTSKDGEALYLRELLNFKIMDKILGEIGFIHSFSSNSVQDLLIVSRVLDKEVLSIEKVKHRANSSVFLYEIPFVKEFVEEIDYAHKIIYMNLPEGLLEINAPDRINKQENEDD